jgi:hypothetical protein
MQGFEVRKGLAAALAGAALAGPAFAQAGSDAELARDDRMTELERKVEVLTEELARTRAEQAVPEETTLESFFGFGPAASKVYGVTRGLSLGGYGEGFYQNIVGDQGTARDSADLLRLVLYAGYKFTDRILFNSEIEFEHASTGSGGEVSVEFANLDFMIHEYANARAGLMLIPMGFLNEIHEPPFYYGVNRPEVERQIIPSTWRENGVGVFGRLLDETVDYKLYVVNSFEASGFDSTGLRGGRQNGARAVAEHLAFVGSVDWMPWEPLTLGGSVFYGNTGQNQPGIPDAPLHLWEVHAQLEAWGLHLRTLFTMAHLGEAGELTTALRGTGDIGATETIGEEMLGVYGEIAYDVLPLVFPDTEMSLEPFFRYEYYDTQYEVPSGFAGNDARAIEIHTVGFSFEPIPQVVIKADYRSRGAEGGDKLPDEFNLGMGFVF